MRRRTFLTFASGTVIGTAAGATAAIQWPRLAGLMPSVSRSGLDNPPVIDLHFGTMLGRGWMAQQQPSWNKVVSTPIMSGPSHDSPASIAVVNTAAFVPGQLACLKCADDEYRTALINGISDQEIRFAQPLPHPPAADTRLYNFLLNDSHATPFGYFAIADDAIRQLADRPARVLMANGMETWNKLGPVRFSENWSSAYSNPGTSNPESYALMIEVEEYGDGIISRGFELERGSYRIKLPIGVIGATDRGVHMQISAVHGEEEITRNSLMMFDGTGMAQLDVTVQTSASIQVTLRLAMAAKCQLSIGRLEIQRKYATSVDIHQGRHILFGDSWINASHITRRLRYRLPNTQFIQSGVPGSTLEDLLARFDRDVTPQKPNYVWVMCGTNDVYKMWDVDYFQGLAVDLRDKIRAINAKPIFWNPSVCNRTYQYGDRLAPSRRLAIEVNYGAEQSA